MRQPVILSQPKTVPLKIADLIPRMAIDIAMMIAIGRFFSANSGQACYSGLPEESDKSALEESLRFYRKARGFLG